MKRTIITVVGHDTVGIIAKVCTYLAENQINILDISQTIVQEYFNRKALRYHFRRADETGRADRRGDQMPARGDFRADAQNLKEAS